jgi:hypothetical protein
VLHWVPHQTKGLSELGSSRGVVVREVLVGWGDVEESTKARPAFTAAYVDGEEVIGPRSKMVINCRAVRGVNFSKHGRVELLDPVNRSVD